MLLELFENLSDFRYAVSVLMVLVLLVRLVDDRQSFLLRKYLFYPCPSLICNNLICRKFVEMLNDEDTVEHIQPVVVGKKIVCAVDLCKASGYPVQGIGNLIQFV